MNKCDIVPKLPPHSHTNKPSYLFWHVPKRSNFGNTQWSRLLDKKPKNIINIFLLNFLSLQSEINKGHFKAQKCLFRTNFSFVFWAVLKRIFDLDPFRVYFIMLSVLYLFVIFNIFQWISEFLPLLTVYCCKKKKNLRGFSPLLRFLTRLKLAWLWIHLFMAFAISDDRLLSRD